MSSPNTHKRTHVCVCVCVCVCVPQGAFQAPSTLLHACVHWVEEKKQLTPARKQRLIPVGSSGIGDVCERERVRARQRQGGRERQRGTRTCTHTHTHARTRTHTHTYTHACTHTYFWPVFSTLTCDTLSGLGESATTTRQRGPGPDTVSRLPRTPARSWL